MKNLLCNFDISIYTHFIFDVDGTLIESDFSEREIFQSTIIDFFGVAPNVDFGLYRDLTYAGIVSEIAVEHGFSQAETEACYSELGRRLSVNANRVQWRPAAYAEKLVKAASNAGDVFYLSGNFFDVTARKLEAIGVIFSPVQIISVDLKKPSKSLHVSELVDKVGVDVVGWVFLGDSEYDKLSARSAGVSFMWSQNLALSCWAL
ncbi:HAD hydrolase-like protein [Teredinibacter turnerae]|uniref:HAD hydrolase-like protein n=1 Tax=Teredinibacter turnerae TaxID=2426 RepID=UPI000AEB5A7E|nr:HAD hydrolase-like protein [Teredinibacter turnerae]